MGTYLLGEFDFSYNKNWQMNVSKLFHQIALVVGILLLSVIPVWSNTNNDQANISFIFEETKKGGLTAVVTGLVSFSDAQGLYDAEIQLSAPGLTVDKSCELSSILPNHEEIVDGVEEFTCRMNVNKGQVLLSYQRFHLEGMNEFQGSMIIAKNGMVLSSGNGVAKLENGSNPNPSVVKLIAVAKTGRGNAGQLEVANAMSQHCNSVGGCTAAIMAGNIILDNGVSSVDDVLWVNNFELPYDQPGLLGLNFYAVPGSHDYGFSSTGSVQAMLDYSALPVGIGPGTRLSDKFTMPTRFYDVVLGGGLVHLFGVDTQDTMGGSPTDQLDDMQARVQNSTANWKIVFGDFARFTSGNSQSDLPIIDPLLPSPGLFAFQQAVYCESDIYIAGDDDIREFMDKGQDPACPNTHFAIVGAAAAVDTTLGPTPTSHQLFVDNTIEGFAYIEISLGSMIFEFYDKNGNLSFTKTILK